MEKEFLKSWAEIELFFQRIAHRPEGNKLLQFIKDLRVLEYDKKLRAGQSMFMLILSKTLHHGLNQKQKFVAIHAFPTHVNITSDALVKRIKLDDFVINDETLELINNLLLEPIN